MSSPKISIITPNFNQAGYIEETILSVIGQNYPKLEYIIIDGGSTDGSVDIIKKYEKQITYWVSEPDAGLYYALQKGFDKATGEILGWINSDDKLHPNALHVVGELFDSFENVNWITGCPSGFDEKGYTVALGEVKRWSKYDFYLYDYKWIQQESTFWRRSLWDKAGRFLNKEIKYAADFELWLRFFRYDKLFTVRTILGGFRFRSSSQMSVIHSDKYQEEANGLIDKEILTLSKELKKHLLKYKLLLSVIKYLKRIRIFMVLFSVTYINNKMSDAPELIEFDPKLQKFSLME